MNSRIDQLIEQSGMKLNPRRPYDDDQPDGYMESDDSMIDNNLKAIQEFLDGGLKKHTLATVSDVVANIQRLYGKSLPPDFEWVILNLYSDD